MKPTIYYHREREFLVEWDDKIGAGSVRLGRAVAQIEELDALLERGREEGYAYLFNVFVGGVHWPSWARGFAGRRTWDEMISDACNCLIEAVSPDAQMSENNSDSGQND